MHLYTATFLHEILEVDKKAYRELKKYLLEKAITKNQKVIKTKDLRNLKPEYEYSYKFLVDNYIGIVFILDDIVYED